MATELNGKIALVTGASSGIGRACAVALAGAGATVALAARRRDRLDEVVAEIERAGGRASASLADVSSEDAVQALVTGVHERHGRLDLLVNAAGVMLPAPIEDATGEEWRRMLDANVLGLMASCRAAIPLMRAGGGGVIVNIASTAGRETRPGFSGYDASKYAVVGFSDALRREVHKDRIRVTVIEPGAVNTELVANISNGAMRSAAEQYVGSIEMLEPEDIAAAVVFAATQPGRVQVNELLIRPTAEA